MPCWTSEKRRRNSANIQLFNTVNTLAVPHGNGRKQTSSSISLTGGRNPPVAYCGRTNNLRRNSNRGRKRRAFCLMATKYHCHNMTTCPATCQFYVLSIRFLRDPTHLHKTPRNTATSVNYLPGTTKSNSFAAIHLLYYSKSCTHRRSPGP